MSPKSNIHRLRFREPNRSRSDGKDAKPEGGHRVKSLETGNVLSGSLSHSYDNLKYRLLGPSGESLLSEQSYKGRNELTRNQAEREGL